MKRGKLISIILVIGLCCFLATNGIAAKKLLDDFSGPRIDTTKWKEADVVREVNTATGKLVLKLANRSESGNIRNSLVINDPDSITALKCDIKLVSAQLDSGGNATAFARVGGFFYNTKTAGGATGDIFAAVVIADKGFGPEAYFDVVEVLNDEVTDFTLLKSEQIVPPGGLPTESVIEIAFNGTETFDFTVNGTKKSYTSAPKVERPAVTKFKGPSVGLNADTHVGDGYVYAEFDNIYTNGDTVNVYDDFSKEDIDLGKWYTLATVREIDNGKLRLNVQANGARAQETLGPIDDNTDYLEAKVQIAGGSTVSNGARGIIRLAGFYYNESKGPGQYNGFLDDVWVDLRITLEQSGNLSASCSLTRTDNPEDTIYTTLFVDGFNLPIKFNTFYHYCPV
jgi:hypothetical protein